jgi:hypothetical protein
MNIGHCSGVSNLFADLCFAHRADFLDSKSIEKGFSVDPSAEKHSDNMALRHCLSRFVSKAFSHLEDADQSLQQSTFKRFQAYILLDSLMQENKSSYSEALSAYV